MMKNARALLKAKIKEFVFPYLESLEFEEMPSREIAAGGASRTRCPFGTWTRMNPDGSVDLIEFKFDKYAHASFEFDFAQIQKNGGYGTYVRHSQDKAQANGVGEYGRYRPKIFTTSNPISLSFGKRLLKNERAADKKIQNWMKGLDQIEDWFETRKVGSYLITFEQVSRGVSISRGFREKLIFKSTSIGYFKSTKDNDFVETYEQAVSVAEQYYREQGKTLNLSKQFWWKFDGL
ncbi:MAG: hypothetical protein ABJO36_11700 [Litorimonas sp.]